MDKKRFIVVYRKVEAIRGKTDVTDLEIERAFNRYVKVSERTQK